jgi:hypothetical protein
MMEQYVSNLINRIRELEVLISDSAQENRSEAEHINSFQVISEMHEWLNLCLELIELFGLSDDKFYSRFNEYSQDGNGIVLYESHIAQKQIITIAIKKIEAGILSVTTKTDVIESVVLAADIEEMNNGSIFISHSSVDKKQIELFVDLILDNGIGISTNDVFCTSLAGMKITSGEDWRDEIRKHLKGSTISFLFISEAYNKSEVCLAEMGAAWVCSKRTIPINISVDTEFRDIGVIQSSKQGERLNDESSLDRIRDILVNDEEVKTEPIPSDRWSEKKKDFLQRLAQIGDLN